MALRINTNVAAMNTAHILGGNNADLGTRLERLASGRRINGAEDDAAGLVISEGFRAQITGMAMGVRNAEMGNNMLQSAEGSLNEVSAILVRMRELAIQSASSTVNDFNRESIEAEVTQLKQELTRMAQSSTYNDQTLLTGFGNTVKETDTNYVDGDVLPDGVAVGDVKDPGSTALTESDTTGVTNINATGVPEGTYTFTAETTDGNRLLTLSGENASQTLDLDTLLDGDKVAAGSTAVFNFDRLGISVTVAGTGVEKAEGDYEHTDLDGKTIVITGGAEGFIQVGANAGEEDRIPFTISDMTSGGDFLSLNTVSVGTLTSARDAIGKLGEAIGNTAQVRGHLGAVMNRLQNTINFTSNSIENNTNSESTIRDADMAAEVTNYTRSQVLSQASTVMLTQANTTPQQALQLLGG